MSTKNGLNFQKPLLFLLKKLTGKRDLELIGNEPSGKKSAEKLQGSARKSTLNDSSNSSPDVLESASKMEMKKKSPNEAKGRPKLDVSVAAATPLPKIDEEGIWDCCILCLYWEWEECSHGRNVNELMNNTSSSKRLI